jgi:type II secretory pathway component PulF
MLAIVLSMQFATYLAAPLATAISILIVGGIVIGICYLCDVPVLRPFGDMVFRNRATSHVLRILALAAELRHPFSHVLSGLAFVYPSPVMRSRLSPVAVAVEAGANWCDTLSKSRLISQAESALLKSAERAGNLPWALRQIATRRQKRTMYRLHAAVHVVYPLVILAFGAFVGFYVIALFVPIVSLIQSLTY